MKNFLALILFGTGIAGWFWYHNTKEAREALKEGLPQLELQEQMVAIRQSEFDTIVRALELKKQVIAKQQELAQIQARHQGLNQQFAALQLQKKQQVTVDRQIMVGTVMTDLALSDGRKFPEARITKIDDSSISFAIPTGVLKVKPSDLTLEVRQYLQYK